MANYCKTCGADLPVETKPTTWNEILDFVKNLKRNQIRVVDYDGELVIEIGSKKHTYMQIHEDRICGSNSLCVIAQNRSFEQIKTIIENLI